MFNSSEQTIQNNMIGIFKQPSYFSKVFEAAITASLGCLLKQGTKL
jgi:hypothetical protein